jgi:hypothetical protein
MSWLSLGRAKEGLLGRAGGVEIGRMLFVLTILEKTDKPQGNVISAKIVKN